MEINGEGFVAVEKVNDQQDIETIRGFSVETRFWNVRYKMLMISLSFP